MDVLALAPLLISFRRLVAHQGLRPAARATGISTSTLSRHLNALEEQLGMRLADRNTRAFALTPAGVQLATSLGDLEGLLRQSVEAIGPTVEAHGRVRISAPTMLTSGPLLPVMAAFRARHPHAVLQVVNDDQLHAFIDEVDLVIRNGPLRDPDLMARLLFRTREVVVASPSLARAPIDAEALAALPWVVLTHVMPAAGHVLHGPGGARLQLLPEQRIETTSSDHAIALIRAGLGVGIILEGLTVPGLEPLGWFGQSLDFMLAHAGGTRPSRLVRSLADLVVEHFDLSAPRL